MNEEHIPPEEAIQRLGEFGFEKYGHWEPVDKNIKKNGILFVPETGKEIPNLRGIYAFVACKNNKPVEKQPVKYIGINEVTNGTVAKRINRYSKNKKNQKKADQIIELLEEGCSVEIHVYIPNYETKSPRLYKDAVEIDFVKGLENGLIRYLDAEWNKKR